MASAPNPRLRARIELMIRIAAPALDLVLAAGEAVSRLLAPADASPAPVRMGHPGTSAPRGLGPGPTPAAASRPAP